MIIVASCLDEKLTFSEDSSGAPSEEIRLSCFKGEQPFFPFGPPPSLFTALGDSLDEYGFHEVFFSI